MKKTTILWLVIGILAIVAGFFYLRSRDKSQSLTEQQNLVSALTDTLTLVKNKDSSTTATIEAYSLRESEHLQSIKGLRSENDRLLALEKQYRAKIKDGGSITNSTSNTGINTTVPTIVSGKDTIRIKDSVFVYPTYYGEINLSPWITGFSLATKDSTQYKINVYNETDVILYRNKGKYQADVILLNPYSIHSTVRALNVTGPKPKRFGLTATAGYGAVYQNKQVTLAPFVGVGLGYLLWGF